MAATGRNRILLVGLLVVGGLAAGIVVGVLQWRPVTPVIPPAGTRPAKALAAEHATVVPEEPSGAAAEPITDASEEWSVVIPESRPTRETLDARLREALADSRSKRYQNLRELGASLALWANEDHTALFEYLNQLENSSDRLYLLRGYLFALAQSDPGAAITLAWQANDRLQIESTRSSTNAFGRISAITAAATGWARADLAGLVEWAQQLDGGGEKRAIMGVIADEWSRQDLQGAVAWAAYETAENGDDFLLRRIGMQYAARDLEAALGQLDSLPAGKVYDSFLAGVVGRWAREAPETALAAVLNMDDGALRTGALYSAVNHWATKDPAAAAAWAADNLTGSLARGTLDTALRHWSLREPEAAAAFARGVEDDATRVRLLASVAAEWGRRDPRAAVELLRDLPAGRDREQATDRLVSNWARRDPAGAAQWVSQFPAGTQRQSVLNNVALQWAKREPQATVEWVARLPRDSAKYSAVLACAAAQLKFSDAATMGQWQQVMRQPNLDAATAASWLRQADLPETLRKTLLGAL